MTDLTPYYWAVIYRSPAHPDGPLISLPMREPSAEAASDRALSSRQISDVLSVAGPFGTPAEAEAYRLSWMRDQRATGQASGSVNRQRTMADLLNEAASAFEGEPVTLYGAFNAVICGDPDDTRGDRNGVNSADLVRTFAAFLGVRSPLEWSQAPERTHAEIVNALRGCASTLLDAAGRADLSAFLVSDPTADEEIETGPGFPVACSSVHEHDPEACAPEAPATEVTTATETGSRGIVWAVTAETFGETDTDTATASEPSETFVRVDDITALVTVHRAAGASVEVTWPFGSDGTGIPTYVHVYVDGRGVVTYRRANPGESDL